MRTTETLNNETNICIDRVVDRNPLEEMIASVTQKKIQ